MNFKALSTGYMSSLLGCCTFDHCIEKKNTGHNSSVVGHVILKVLDPRHLVHNLFVAVLTGKQGEDIILLDKSGTSNKQTLSVRFQFGYLPITYTLNDQPKLSLCLASWLLKAFFKVKI